MMDQTLMKIYKNPFALREYGEMFLLRNIEDGVIIDIYEHINKSDDWNKAILPMNWGYITFPRRTKSIFFALFDLCNSINTY